MILLVLISPVPSCRQQEVLSVDQLTSQPTRYNGKQIVVEGYYFSGFEIVALSGELVASTYRPANVSPKQPLIWLTGSLGESVYNQLKTQSNTPSGYDEHYGKVKITGTFQTGGKYGHLDSYQYRLVISSAELLTWPTDR